MNESFWRECLGGVPIAGLSIRIDDRQFDVIGVVSARYPLGVDVWVPLALSPSQWDDRHARNVQAVALIEPAATLAAAEADARRVAAVLAETHPDTVWVVEDIALNWYDGRPRPTLYLPHAQTAARAMTLVLRSNGAPPEALAGPLRAALRSVERDPPPIRSYSLRKEVDDSLAPLLTLAWLLAALAAIAVALATAGIYGLARSVVGTRRREMGIRVALGARPRTLARLVLEGVARPVGLGCVVGVPVAMALARWLGGHTFGLLALEPAVPIGIGALLMTAAALGAWSPSRRAARIDPVVVLRE